MSRCGVTGFLVDDGSHDGWGAIGGDMERDKGRKSSKRDERDL